MLLRHFVNTVDAIYRVFHVPTTWNWLKDLYADVTPNKPPSATQLSFFLSVFATSVYVSRVDFQFETVALRGQSKIALAGLWFKQAVVLLTKPRVPASTQALQAIMTLVHLGSQIESVSGIFPLLSGFGFQMARSMRIHRLDTAPLREERRKNGADMVDLEMKRRVWWHMAISDWSAPSIQVSHQGAHLI